MPVLQLELVAEALDQGRRIGIVPGGFKPPHAGHYMGAEHLLTKGKADEVYVLIGHKTRLGLSKDGETAETGIVFAGYGLQLPASDGTPEYDSYVRLAVGGDPFSLSFGESRLSL